MLGTMIATAVNKPKAIPRVVKLTKPPHGGRHRMQGKWWGRDG